jgi:hypothetical protein
MPESNKGSDDKGLAYYAFFAVVSGFIGMLVGIVIARELGECIYHDDPTSGADDVSTFYEYTQAGKAWVGGSTGVGVFIGIFSMMLYRNDARSASNLRLNA